MDTAAATVIVMRHAKALEQRPGELDFDRPLAPRGIKEAAAMGRWLHAQTPELRVIVSSPALRAQMTSETVAAAWGATLPALDWKPALYLAELPALLEELELSRPGPTLLVGHNPGLEELLEYLVPAVSGESGASRMPAAAIYIIGLRADKARITRGSGTIRAQMWPARLKLR